MEEKVFKTEEEKFEAINNLPDNAPKEVTEMGDEAINEWEKKNLDEAEALMEAKIDPEHKPVEEEPPEKKPSEEQPPGKKPPEEQPPVDKGEEQRQLFEMERETMHRENQEALAQIKKELLEEKEKRKALEEKKAEEPVGEIKEPEEDVTVKHLKGRLDEINLKIKDADPNEDLKVYNDLVQEKLDIRDQLSEKKSILTEKKYMAEIQKIKAANKKEKEDQATVAAENKKNEDQVTADRKAKETMLEEVDDFQVHNTEFKVEDKDKKPVAYEQMYQGYLKFAKEVAADYWPGKTVFNSTKDEQEVAVQKYLQNPAMFNDNLAKRGVVVPPYLKKYLTLSELVYLQRGWQLNPRDGKYVPYKDKYGNKVTFPSIKAAWTHMQDISGKRGEELLKENIAGAQGILDAQTQRANPQELSREHQGKQKPDINIDPDEALKKLEMTDDKGQRIFDETKIAQLVMETPEGKPLPPVVQEYNKLLKVLEQEPITKETFQT